MYIVGLTGAIGSGKSTLAKLLQDKGAIIIDADRIGHDLLNDSKIKSQLHNTFGPEVLVNNHIDRNKLAEKAFVSISELKKLNHIMWPPIVGIIESEIQMLSKKMPANEIVIIEAPLLLEAGLDQYIKLLIGVISSTDKQIERLKAKGYTADEANRRIRMQMPKEDLIQKSDYLVRNDDGIKALEEEAEKVWHFIKKQSA